MDPKLMEDVSRLMGGAMHNVSALKQEMEKAIQERVQQMLRGLDVVSREEYELALGMVQKAREEQESLKARVSALEAALAAMPSKKPASAKA